MTENKNQKSKKVYDNWNITEFPDSVYRELASALKEHLPLADVIDDIVKEAKKEMSKKE